VRDENYDFNYDGQAHQNGAQLFDSYEDAIRATERSTPLLDGTPTLLGVLREMPDRQTVMIAGGLLVLGAALIGTGVYLRRR